VEQVVLSAAFIGLALIFLLVFAWMKAHGAISRGVLDTMRWEIDAFDYGPSRTPMMEMINAIPASSASLLLLAHVIGMVSAEFALPLSILVTSLGILLVVVAPSNRHATPLTLDGLMKQQATVFRSIAAYLPRHLVPVAPLLPTPRPADPALHFGEWLFCHALDNGAVFQSDRAVAALDAQLGDIWTGIETAPPAARMMIAVCALHLARRRKDATDLLGLVSESLATETAGEGGSGPAQPLVLGESIIKVIDGYLADSGLRTSAEVILRRHGFVTTAVMGLLNTSRARAGILAPAQFNFLKLVDRNLWYALQSLGFPISETEDGPMPNPKIEALAARAHWEAERAAGSPLVIPHIDAAIEQIASKVHAAEAKNIELKDLR
jgi:intracellular multiplication protein IcmP